MTNEEKIVYFAETDFRNKRRKFGIKAIDRLRHMYIIGKTGMGKSTLLENLAIQDIQNGEGLAFIDPHGSAAEKLLDYIPESRIKDVIYFSPFDLEWPISFNVMEQVDKDKRHLVVAGLMSTFKKIWVDAWSARMEYILANTLLALLEYPGATLLGVNRMYTDKEFRSNVISKVTDPGVRSFWVDEYAQYTERFAAEATPAIQNKVGQFTSNPLIRNVIGQPTSSVDFRDVIDNKKIFIANLSKGRVGEGNAALLGSMLITKIYLAAMSRASVSPAKLKMLPAFYLYVDEFQSFANESFANILSESRKYKLSLTMAHQYIDQMSEEVRDAVFGNVGTTIAFRVGPLDAELLEKMFSPKFTGEDLVNLGFAQTYLTLMINGVGSPPFSAVTLAPFPKPERIFTHEIVEYSRKTYARPRDIVEQEIARWHSPVVLSPEAVAISQFAPSGKKKRKRKKKGGGMGGGMGTGGGAMGGGHPLPPPTPGPSLKELLSGVMVKAKEVPSSSSTNPSQPPQQPRPNFAQQNLAGQARQNLPRPEPVGQTKPPAPQGGTTQGPSNPTPPKIFNPAPTQTTDKGKSFKDAMKELPEEELRKIIEGEGK